MTVSKLGRILELFQNKRIPLSLGYIAHQLEISPQMAESMLQYWIQKGVISKSAETADCGLCGMNNSCPYVYQLPAIYQLVSEGDKLN